MENELLSVKGLKKFFPVRKGGFLKKFDYLYAVDDISFSLKKGETLGLVGESGCGKTTVGRCILRLIEATAGEVCFEGENILQKTKAEMRKIRKDMQIIFQDPYGSLDPRMTIEQIIKEPFEIHKVAKGSELEERVVDLLKRVGLRPELRKRYPSEFSGGQRQRIGIARSIALKPKFIVGDEPVSALDVSIQAQIINLLEELKSEYQLSYLIIAHDLSVVEYISDRVAVMYLGKIVEIAKRSDLYSSPHHPYTEALISAVPVPDVTHKKKRIMLEGEIPSPMNPPSGCYFHTRCRYKKKECESVTPVLKEIGEEHFSACYVR